MGWKKLWPVCFLHDILVKVEKVDGVETQVYENEENVGEPEEDFEQSQSSVEPESVISQATIGIFHQHESEILNKIFFKIFKIVRILSQMKPEDVIWWIPSYCDDTKKKLSDNTKFRYHLNKTDTKDP